MYTSDSKGRLRRPWRTNSTRATLDVDWLAALICRRPVSRLQKKCCIMSQDEISKVEKPHKHFEAPLEVSLDPALSKEQKLQALDHLEQDARQLAIASSEGMSGGEGTNLHEVLTAKDALELPPTAHAYDAVLHDLRLRQRDNQSAPLRDVIGRAISALEALQSMDRRR